jgi:hypothetical protein
VPKFFFHLEGSPDDLGIELPSLAAAKCEAARYAGRLLCDDADKFWSSAQFDLTVSDEQGLSLFSISIHGVEAPVIRVAPKLPT